MRLLALALLLFACNSSDPPADASRADAACTPGMFLGRCMCGTEPTGSVSCLPSGFGTTGCVCPDAATPADAVSDGPATPDAPTDAAAADGEADAARDAAPSCDADITSDPRNCGACGRACTGAPQEGCFRGVCRRPMCPMSCTQDTECEECVFGRPPGSVSRCVARGCS